MKRKEAASEMAPWAVVPATKTNDLSLVSQNHIMEKENPQAFL